MKALGWSAIVILAAGLLITNISLRVVNKELKEQHELNQELIDHVNKHEAFLAMHNCSITRILQREGLISPGPIPPCVPNFLKFRGDNPPPESTIPFRRRTNEEVVCSGSSSSICM